MRSPGFSMIHFDKLANDVKQGVAKLRTAGLMQPARAFCATRRAATRTQIVQISLEFSRFYFTRFIRNRIFTQPEVTITFILC